MVYNYILSFEKVELKAATRSAHGGSSPSTSSTASSPVALALAPPPRQPKEPRRSAWSG